MNRSTTFVVVIALILPLLGTATPSYASDGSTSAAAVTSAGDTIKPGDYVTIKDDAPIFFDASDSKLTGSKYCAPGESRFLVNAIDPSRTSTTVTASAGGSATTTTTSGNKTSTTVPAGGATVDQSTDSLLHVSFAQKPNSKDVTFWLSPVAWYRFLSPDVKDDITGKCAPSAILKPGAYQVNASDLANYGTYRKGFTWGAMVVPYKFEFHDHSFQAAPAVMGYFGFEGWWSGLSLANIIALGGGAASSSVTSTQSAAGSNTITQPGAATSSSTKPFYSIAVGEIATFGGKFKVGVLVGADWQGSGNGYKYEGKPWIAISAGF